MPYNKVSIAYGMLLPGWYYTVPKKFYLYFIFVITNILVVNVAMLVNQIPITISVVMNRMVCEFYRDEQVIFKAGCELIGCIVTHYN